MENVLKQFQGRNSILWSSDEKMGAPIIFDVGSVTGKTITAKINIISQTASQSASQNGIEEDIDCHFTLDAVNISSIRGTIGNNMSTAANDGSNDVTM